MADPTKPEFLQMMEYSLKEKGWSTSWGYLYGHSVLLLERFQYYGVFIGTNVQDGTTIIARAMRYYDDAGENWSPRGKPTIITIANPEALDQINSILDGMKREKPYVNYVTDSVSGRTVEEL